MKNITIQTNCDDEDRFTNCQHSDCTVQYVCVTVVSDEIVVDVNALLSTHTQYGCQLRSLV